MYNTLYRSLVYAIYLKSNGQQLRICTNSGDDVVKISDVKNYMNEKSIRSVEK
jgi:hypothetical protein